MGGNDDSYKDNIDKDDIMDDNGNDEDIRKNEDKDKIYKMTGEMD